MQMKIREEKWTSESDEAVNTIENGPSDSLIDESGVREQSDSIPRLPGIRASVL